MVLVFVPVIGENGPEMPQSVWQERAIIAAFASASGQLENARHPFGRI